MSIQQNFPNTKPSLNLNFSSSQKLDPRITFTRTSSATRVNSDGLIEVVPANSPRFDFDPVSGECLGLLVEEQRSNTIQVSAPAPADISKAGSQEGWLNQNIPEFVYTSVLGPDGVNNAINVNLTNTLGSNFALPFVYNQQYLLSNNTFYTLSFWVDASDLVEISDYHLSTIVGINLHSLLTGRLFRIKFNKNTNTFGSIDYFTGSSVTAENAQTIFPLASISGKATNYPNNYKKIEITFKLENYDGFYDSGNTLADLRFSYGIYMGISDSTNSNVGRNLKTWGWQLESGSFSTSYIPTSGSTATRTTDNANIIGSDVESWYRQDEGTFISDSRILKSGVQTQGVWIIGDGTNQISLRSPQVTADRFRGNIGNVFTSAPGTGNILLNTFRAAISYNSTIGRLQVGTASTEVTPSQLPVNPNTFGIGNLGGGSAPLNGIIKWIVYYPIKLNNNILETFTK